MKLLPIALRATAGLCVGIALSSPAAASPVKPSLNDILSARAIDGVRISPNGRQVAFRVITPDIKNNRETVQWYASPVGGGLAPTALGGPHNPVWMPLFAMPEDPVAQWLPGGDAIATLVEKDSEIQVRAVGVHGLDQALTHDPADVRSFRLDADGKTLRYVTGRDRAAIEARQTLQNYAGIHLDGDVYTEGSRLTDNYRIGDRLMTVRHSTSPVMSDVAFSGPDQEKQIALPTSLVASAIAAKDDPVARPAVADFQNLKTQKTALNPLPDQTKVEVERLEAPDRLWHLAQARIVATLPNGEKRVCTASFCVGSYPMVRMATTNRTTGEVVVLGYAFPGNHPRIYGWTPKTNKSRLIWESDGILTLNTTVDPNVCPVVGDNLICIFSAPTRPQELVGINLTTGKLSVLADPNADLATRYFPPVHLVHWKGVGDTVMTGFFVEPYDHPKKPPLVITSYTCPGFLNGSMTSLTPEFILAQHGIAAMCINMVTANIRNVVLKPNLAPIEMHKDAVRDLETAINTVVGEGLVDRTRIGISGHSYSSMTIAYAISHTDLFAAASIGTGITIDPMSWYLRAPTANSWGRESIAMLGLPQPDADPTHIWEKESPALNAAHIKAPLLMQPPENEYLFALQLYAGITDAGGKVDMFFYPNEGHMFEQQPQQRRSRAERSIAWFRFWLNGERDLPEIASDDLQYWKKLGSPQSAYSGENSH